MVSVAIFAPLVDAGGAFFCLEVFPIFIKFLGVLCFCTVGGTSDFLKFDLRLRNSVHTMTPRHTPIGLGGGRVGFGSQGIQGVKGIREHVVVY